MIINAWQQIENVEENILTLETGNNGDPEKEMHNISNDPYNTK